MSYTSVAEIVQETIERFVAAGVSREVIEAEMKGVELVAVLDLTEASRDDQLLLTFERYGWEACAERYGVAERTIRDRRNAALNRQARRRMAAA